MNIPSHPEYEKAILGALILNPKLLDIVEGKLQSTDFYINDYARVYYAMVGLWRRNAEINPLTVYEQVRKAHEYGDWLSASEITGYTMGIPLINIDRPALLESWVWQVKKDSVARSIVTLCETSVHELAVREEDVESVLNTLNTDLAKFEGQLKFDNEQAEATALADIVPSLAEQFSNYHQNVTTGVNTGLTALDVMLDGGGLQPGGLYVVGAMEKTGKTSLVLGWAYHIAAIQKHSVLFITMEMSKETLSKRIYSAHMGIPYAMFRPGMYDSPNNPVYTKSIEGLTEFGKLPILIADKLFNLDAIVRHVHRQVTQSRRDSKDIKVVFIDYLQIIEAVGKHSTREREVASISRELKKLSSELGVPVVVISNMNRQGMQEGMEPTSLNLRDSGAIAFDAEAVLLLHNPSYVPGKPYTYKPVTDISLIVDRQRNGPTGKIPLKFVGSFMQFLTEAEYAQVVGGGDPTPTKTHTELDTIWDEMGEM